MDEQKNDKVETVEEVEVTVEKDEITLLTEKLAQTESERDNYKNVALKRLGKLPNDAEFMDNESELTVAEQVRIALLDREVEAVKKEREEATMRIMRENAELKLALKNQPGQTLGSGTGSTTDVKDNVFSEAQLAELRKRAQRVNADPEDFINRAKQNLAKRQ